VIAARLGLAWQGVAGHGEAWRGSARQDKGCFLIVTAFRIVARHGSARRGRARLGLAWLGEARRVEAGPGVAWQDKARNVFERIMEEAT
jgi:hypothetical protein